MVVRFWSARTTQVHFPDYMNHFSLHVLPSLRAVDGFLEARILSQSDGVVVHFIVETLWDSLDAIVRYAGADREAAVVADEALNLLTSYDRRVLHYQVDLYKQHRAPSSAL